MILEERIKLHGARVAESFSNKNTRWDNYGQHYELKRAYLSGYEEGLKVGRLAGKLEALEFADVYTDGGYAGIRADKEVNEAKLEAVLGEE